MRAVLVAFMTRYALGRCWFTHNPMRQRGIRAHAAEQPERNPSLTFRVVIVGNRRLWLSRASVQWRGLKESDRRAGYVSALISASFATNQGINISRSP